MKQILTPETMRLRMADLCARTEQCEYDIRMKLRRAAIAASDADDIIAFLRRERFVDDDRYACAFARDKVRFSAWGPYKVRLALAAKRIPAAVIAKALQSVDQKDYAEALRKTATAKSRSLDLTDRDDRLKLYRHILSRGFESDKAKEAIRALL